MIQSILSAILGKVYDSTNTAIKVVEQGGGGSVDGDGYLNVNIQTLTALISGEDVAADVLKVEQRYNYKAISTATTTIVKSSPGRIGCIRVVGGTLGNVTVYDNTAGSGTVIIPTLTPNSKEQVLIENAIFNTGLTIVTAAATIISVTYK